MSKKHILVISLVIYAVATLFFWNEISRGTLPTLKMEEKDLGRLCVVQVFPNIENGTEIKAAEDEEDETEVADNKDVPKKSENKTKRAKKKATGKPQVIIYHTHSTESYQPYNSGNFHRESEAGTVRDVGNVLTAGLEKQGISVVHCKTLHDRPSYNESYDRSMTTILSLIKKYPTAKYIIDLHRDAAAYAGNKGKTMKIGNETVAKYSLVVGQNNKNYSALIGFARKVNSKAGNMYSGFSGEIIEKEYMFNEYVANNYLLLEIGNNQNNIKEAKATAKYFANVLGDIINER